MQRTTPYLIDPQTEKERESELYCYIQHLIQIGKISVFDFSLKTRVSCPHFYFAEFFNNQSYDAIRAEFLIFVIYAYRRDGMMAAKPSTCTYDEVNEDLSELMRAGKLSVFDFPYEMRMRNFVWYHFSLFHISGIVKEVPEKEIREFFGKLLQDISVMDQEEKERIFLYMCQCLEDKECQERPSYLLLLEFKKKIELANQKQR